jgi:hypothetical protein
MPGVLWMNAESLRGSADQVNPQDELVNVFEMIRLLNMILMLRQTISRDQGNASG